MQVNDQSGLPYYEQLILHVKQQIVQGILQPGDRLPSVRDMARQEQLNPNTVSKAYKQLEAQQVSQRFTVKEPTSEKRPWLLEIRHKLWLPKSSYSHY